MRLFLAIELSEPARQHLVGVQRDLQADPHSVLGVAWTKAENLHVTLKFLGETDEQHLPELCAALSDMHVEPMELVADRLEYFPPRGPVRILAAGIAGDQGRVCQLYDRIEGKCIELGFPAERREYRPHVTLGRSREGLGPVGSFRRNVRDATMREPGPSFVAGRFVLIESELLPRGPRYAVLATFPREA